ncbi:unnamed protein product [Heligmosomoides polygyrus]|uniref:CN hydrolase domain-containing protein n=1 Tax=Heligmosomoides polygyrus TaxID=6339 RepID=A0A183GSW8_HELPZ|nr:unnamed protein product [Heligmosomoides polygyrus]
MSSLMLANKQYWWCSGLASYSESRRVRIRVLVAAHVEWSAEQGKRRNSEIAVCQLTSDHNVEKNFEICKEMVERATAQNCKMVFFPECFDYVGRNKEENIGLATEENGHIMQRFRSIAKQNSIWISLGGLHNKDPNEPKMPWNSHIVIDDEGNTAALYNKLHLFDLEIPGKVRLMESEFSKRGTRMVPPVDTPVGRLGLSICYDLRFAELALWNRNKGAQILSYPSAFTLNTGLAHWEMVPPVDTPVGRLGLSICYDLRFAELALWNRNKGAQILSYPSAFTLNTGLAHWEPLLRARAIESQCYVVAAAQTGKHNEKRSSYGHSMVIDPWGAVVAQCSERVDMCFAEIDLSYVAELRQMQPVFAHRRHDLYTLHVNEVDDGKNSFNLSLDVFHIVPIS